MSLESVTKDKFKSLLSPYLCQLILLWYNNMIMGKAFKKKMGKVGPKLGGGLTESQLFAFGKISQN